MESGLLDPREIDQVRRYVLACMRRCRSKQETIDILASTTLNIDPPTTRAVWERMEEANKEMFKAYDRKVALLRDIREKWAYKISSKTLVGRVHRYIERCIQHRLSKKQIFDFLATYCNIDAATARAAWEHLEQENRPLLGAYYSVMFATETSDDDDDDKSAPMNVRGGISPSSSFF